MSTVDLDTDPRSESIGPAGNEGTGSKGSSVWPFRRKPAQPVLLVEPDAGRRELLTSQLRDMQSYGWDDSGHDAAAFLDALPAANDPSHMMERISGKPAPPSAPPDVSP